MTRIAIIQGHPTSGGGHFCHALAEAYAEGAFAGGHQVRLINVADLDFPLLRSKADWDEAPPPSVIAEVQQTLAWAEHLVIIYPLWLGGLPALLKGFLEQALRPAFMTGGAGAGNSWKTALKGSPRASSSPWACPPSCTGGISEPTASRASRAASFPSLASARTGTRSSA
jgi:putative NADPH-quinone reductase